MALVIMFIRTTSLKLNKLINKQLKWEQEK